MSNSFILRTRYSCVIFTLKNSFSLFNCMNDFINPPETSFNDSDIPSPTVLPVFSIVLSWSCNCSNGALSTSSFTYIVVSFGMLFFHLRRVINR